MTTPDMATPGATPGTPAPGWYPDGVTPGVERWFDGAAWHEATRPTPSAAGQPMAPWFAGASAQPWGPGYPPQQGGYPPQMAYPPQWGPGYYGPPPTSMGTGPSDTMHWLLPVGRSWQSIVAGYLGLIALGVWVVGPVAVGFGIWALRVAKTGGHGRGRAWFGIVGGLLGTVFFVWYLAATGS